MKLEDYNCCQFQWHIAMHVRPHKSSSYIRGHLSSSDLNPLTIKCRTNAAVLRRGYKMSVNWSSGWLTCNMGCSRQSLMKLAPVNGVLSVCKLVVVPQMDILSTWFNFQTIYQVGGLQQVLVTNTTVIFWKVLTMDKSFVA